MSISPFGPAADRARDEEARAEVGRVLEKAVEVGKEAADAAKKLVERYMKEADKYKRLAEIEPVGVVRSRRG